MNDAFATTQKKFFLQLSTKTSILDDTHVLLICGTEFMDVNQLPLDNNVACN